MAGDGKYSVKLLPRTAQADKLRGTPPFLRQGVWRQDICAWHEPETTVIGGISKHKYLDDIRISQSGKAIPNERAANTLTVKRRSNGNRAQQRYVVGGAGNGAPAETCMPNRNSINNCDE